MKPNDAEFLKKLQSAFRTEAEEHLQAISSGLLQLEKEPDPARGNEIVSVIFREAHSLKGAARAVNSGDIESICQSLETVLASWKQADIQRSPALFDPLHEAVNAVGRILPKPDGTSSGMGVEEMSKLLKRLAGCVSAGDKKDSRSTVMSQPRLVENTSARSDSDHSAPAVINSATSVQAVAIPLRRTAPLLRDSVETGSAPVPAHRAGSGGGTSETLRISTAKLDALLLQAEEMLAVKLTAAQRSADLRQLADAIGLWSREWTKMMPDMRTAWAAMPGSATDPAAQAAAAATENVPAFMEWSAAQIKSLQNRLAAHVKAADHDRRATSGMVDALLSDAKKLLMLPSYTLMEPFPKMVRELSRDEGKEIEFQVSGDEVEIDKRVLSEMRDPIMHLLRNAVDHGIEMPEHRVRAGKPSRATIKVAVSQVDGNKIQIAVSDDGRGISPADVNEAAVRRGVISAEEARSLDDQEALWLIFRPEVSTSPMITEISGRGIGMSIVKETVERLGGRIAMETRPGEGTTFRLLLPLTLATFRGLLVHVAGQTFIIPTANVERVLFVSPPDVRTVEMRETIPFNGKVVSLVRMEDVLGLPRSQAPQTPRSIRVVVLAAGESRIAFSVDEILSEQEVLVKRLGMPLSRVRNVAGATVLGSGKAAAILNADDLLKSAAKAGAPGSAAAPTQSASEAPAIRHKSILVVEDSITSRMLIKGILESAGHQVKTAVDGIDALTQLKTEPFDLIVSDVEMPRMGGFELTEKIRADKHLANLPVVLVTALASREHRERGVEAGANAYIAKGSFDQGNLLDVVQRLF